MRYVGKGGVTQDRCQERRPGGQAAGNVQNLWAKVVALRGGHGRNQGRSQTEGEGVPENLSLRDSVIL